MNNSPEIKKRRRAHRWGQLSEWIAAACLILKGYRILALRHKTKVGEIDIIARKLDLVIIVEVKARHSVREAIDAVNITSQRRIENAADVWIAKQRDAHKLSIRFDIIAVRPWKWPAHFENAF